MVTTFGQNCINFSVGSRANEALTNHLVEGFSSMLKYHVKTTEALKRLRADKAGVVSFEYVIVAVCIIAAVLAAYGTTTGTGIGSALSGGIGKIVSAFSVVP